MIKIIHQTWKNKDIPHDLFHKEWIDSWLKFHPDWEYKLWTDDDNRNLIKEHYHEYLDFYDRYPAPIQRADIVRYFILHKFGGLYVDLDCIALRSLDTIIEENEIVLGVEPRCNWNILQRFHISCNYNKEKMLLSNALMYSIPDHPFWKIVFKEALNPYFLNRNPVISTGPILLTRAYENFKNPCGLLDVDSFLWAESNRVVDVDKMTFKDNKKIDKDAYAIHVSLVTWNKHM